MGLYRPPLWIIGLLLPLAACQYVDLPDTSGGTDECTEEECGPAPAAPNIECEDGSIGGPSCQLNEDGDCGWVILECPDPVEECTPQECGPAPAAPNILCDDGSIGGPGPCVRNDDGLCGWTFRDCPP